MRVAFVGDIVGRPGRLMLQRHLGMLRESEAIDLVVANSENASHGFGITSKNAKELLSYGIDVMTGGNHSFDKKEIFEHYESFALLRPANYPKQAPGVGIYRGDVGGCSVAVVNLMGHYGMPMVANPFESALEIVKQLESEGIRYIFIDFHAESTAEKNALFALLKQRVSAIVGTHTHVPTADLKIANGCCYVSDIGLTGCCDGIIGMSDKEPLVRFMEGVGSHLKINNDCLSVLDLIIAEFEEGKAVSAKRKTIYSNGKICETKATLFD